ncbi:MAG TPA: SRPBCC family protein [Candidatus Limnocylindria bacterium]
MIEAKAQLIIERPADEIWAYAAQIHRHPEWMTVMSAEILEGTGSRVGDRGRERMRLGPWTTNAEFTVVAADPGRRISWRPGHGSPFTGDLTLDLEPLGPSRTRATYGGSFRMRGLLRLLEPLLASEARSGQAAELGKLKQAVESSPDARGLLERG